MLTPPSYDSRGLVNLSSELEVRLGGSAPSPPLDPTISRLIPEAKTYVLLLFDGLGSHQLDHARAGSLVEAQAATLDAPFPSTTAVSLASLATGLVPRRHGILGYQMWFEDIKGPVNVLRWTTPWGDPVEAAYESVLPSPNLWERLSAAGAEPITVQPGHFVDSPLSRMLYRGCRLEPAWSAQDLIDATLDLATRPGRLVVTYVPHVDVAAHTAGQSSNEYEEAIRTASRVWEQLAARLPQDTTLVGTADHGHRDYVGAAIVEVGEQPQVEFAGEARALYARGSSEALAELRTLPATAIEPEELLTLWGPEGDDHPHLETRTPDLCLLADTGKALLVPSIGFRWVGFHGGLDPEERDIPLLVA